MTFADLQSMLDDHSAKVEASVLGLRGECESAVSRVAAVEDRLAVLEGAVQAHGQRLGGAEEALEAKAERETTASMQELHAQLHAQVEASEERLNAVDKALAELGATA